MLFELRSCLKQEVVLQEHLSAPTLLARCSVEVGGYNLGRVDWRNAPEPLRKDRSLLCETTDTNIITWIRDHTGQNLRLSHSYRIFGSIFFGSCGNFIAYSLIEVNMYSICFEQIDHFRTSVDQQILPGLHLIWENFSLCPYRKHSSSKIHRK